MARAIQLSIEGVQSGRGGPFGAVIVKWQCDYRRGFQPGDLYERSDGPRGSAGHSPGLRETWRVRAEGLRTLHFLRALSDVLRRDLLGAAVANLFCEHRRGRRQNSDFDDSFIYCELKEHHSPSVDIPANQIMREEALAGFRAWTEKSGKIPY